MKIKIIKAHFQYGLGKEYEVTEERGGYLISIGVAVKVEEKVEEKVNIEEPPKEKIEIAKTKEKAENKTRNVPTAKKKKK